MPSIWVVNRSSRGGHSLGYQIRQAQAQLGPLPEIATPRGTARRLQSYHNPIAIIFASDPRHRVDGRAHWVTLHLVVVSHFRSPSCLPPDRSPYLIKFPVTVLLRLQSVILYYFTFLPQQKSLPDVQRVVVCDKL